MKEIKIENLNFRYKINEKFVLKNFNLSIKRNDIIGIKGQSGEGKSTLINILMGLFEPTDGKIYADKINIFEDISSWQKKISLVQQDIYLIDESVKKKYSPRSRGKRYR